MPRDLPLANGRLLVNFDSHYTLRDLYWPHIGLRNNSEGHANHTGIWVEGNFTWLEDDEWQRDLRYEQDSLITQVTLTHPRLQLSLQCTDAVDFDRDILVRRFRVTNSADHPREVRLFTHHDWHIGESEGANTVYYQPRLKALVAYKDNCYILVNGLIGDDLEGAPEDARLAGYGLSQFATGQKEVNGQHGTWKDAEDGMLGGNPITQGSVDSCAGFQLGTLPPGGGATCYTWLAFGSRFQEVEALDAIVRERGPESLLTRTHNYWHLWVNTKNADHCDLSQELIDLYKRSLLVIRTQIDNDGAVIAATDGDVWTFSRDSYAYMWPRDGALVANALSHSGYGDITSAFFHFCANSITRDGYLLHKYTPEGALGSSWHPWMAPDGTPQLPIQEDETALVVYALWQHYQLFHEVEFVRPLYRPLVKAAADFMVSFREPHTKLPAPSWDLWEERHGIHSYTVAAVYAGLTSAAHFATEFGETDLATTYTQAAQEIQAAARQYLWHEESGRFLRMINVLPDGTIQPDMNIDSSITGLYQFGMFDPRGDEITRTMAAIEARLTIKSKSAASRATRTTTTIRSARTSPTCRATPGSSAPAGWREYHIARAQTLDELHEALPWLEWVRTHALPSGVLAEQIDPYTDAPLSVSPLTWSHAEFVSAVRWYAGKYRRLTGQDGTVPHL